MDEITKSWCDSSFNWACAQVTFTCSKSTIETLAKDVKDIQG